MLVVADNEKSAVLSTGPTDVERSVANCAAQSPKGPKSALRRLDAITGFPSESLGVMTTQGGWRWLAILLSVWNVLIDDDDVVWISDGLWI